MRRDFLGFLFLSSGRLHRCLIVCPIMYSTISGSIFAVLSWLLKNFLRLWVLTLYIQLLGSFFAIFAPTASSWTIFLMVFSLTPKTLSAMWLFRMSGDSSVSSSGGIDLLPRLLSSMYSFSSWHASAFMKVS